MATSTTTSSLVDCLKSVADQYFGARELEPAEQACRLVIEHSPRDVESLSRLGRLSMIRGDHAAALSWFAKVSEIKESPSNLVNIAICLTVAGELGRALAACDRALAMNCNFEPAYIQAGFINEELGLYNAALKYVTKGLKANPGSSELLFARGCLWMLTGTGGYAEYEYRPGRLELARRCDEYAEWTGQDLSGKTILVVREQGIGDQIMFSRWLNNLLEMDCNVILLTMPELARLMADSFPGATVLSSDSQLEDYEPDYWVSICSLPYRICGLNGSAAPLGKGWLRKPIAVPEISKRLKASGKFRVGLAWAGSPKHKRDRLRSMQFSDIANQMPDTVELYSLQAGVAAGQNDGRAIDLGNLCHDILDLAYAVSEMDLIVSVDSAVLHLAGALGRPSIGLIYQPTDWRWRLSGNGPYESMRLLRQRFPGEWLPVLEQLGPAVLKAKKLGRRRDVPTDVYPEQCGVETAGGVMYYHPLCHYIGRAISEYGEYSDSEVRLLAKVLTHGGRVIEAGANVGGLTVPISNIIGKTGKVFAFEPQPVYCDLLRMNAGENVAVYQMALGNVNGVIEMNLIPTDRVHAPGWQSDGPLTDVEIRRIDDLDIEGPIDLIKIDVDGQEHEILKGAEKTIARDRPFIYVEYDKPERYPELLQWLADRDYRLYRHSAPLFNPDNFAGNPVNVFGSLISLMLLCVPNERKNIHIHGLDRIRERV